MKGKESCLKVRTSRPVISTKMSVYAQTSTHVITNTNAYYERNILHLPVSISMRMLFREGNRLWDLFISCSTSEYQ